MNATKISAILADMTIMLAQENSRKMAIDETPEMRDIRMYEERIARPSTEPSTNDKR